MTGDEWLLILVLVAVVGFIATHLRPLSVVEVEQLARKRRKRQVHSYFVFERTQAAVDPFFKSRMNTGGAWHQVSHPLASFPAIAAALLKSKKHEWILFAFEANKCVRLLWFNKGPDRNSVAPLLRDYEIVDAAVTLAVSTVLCFHNHPNAVLTASDQDLRSAAHWSELLTQKGVNLIEFVCGRGEFVEYFRSIADAFLPVDQFAQAIRFTNGITKSRNFTLHLERLF